jgi:hypothetical protein
VGGVIGVVDVAVASGGVGQTPERVIGEGFGLGSIDPVGDPGDPRGEIIGEGVALATDFPTPD